MSQLNDDPQARKRARQQQRKKKTSEASSAPFVKFRPDDFGQEMGDAEPLPEPVIGQEVLPFVLDDTDLWQDVQDGLAALGAFGSIIVRPGAHRRFEVICKIKLMNGQACYRLGEVDGLGEVALLLSLWLERGYWTADKYPLKGYVPLD